MEQRAGKVCSFEYEDFRLLAEYSERIQGCARSRQAREASTLR